jgi:hypothetical protein
MFFLPEKRLPYRRVLEIRAYRVLVAEGKVAAPVCKEAIVFKAAPYTPQSFEEKLAYELEYRRGYSRELALLLANQSDEFETLGWDWKWNSSAMLSLKTLKRFALQLSKIP